MRSRHRYPNPALLLFVAAALLGTLPDAAAKKKPAPAIVESQDTAVYDRRTIGTPPQFKGQPYHLTFPAWIGSQLKYPEALQQEGLGGRVVIRFVVEKNGALSNVEVVESPYLLLSAEVIRVLGLSPRWTPGLNAAGEAIRSLVAIPVNFVCTDSRKDKKLPPQLRQGQHVF